MYEISRETYDLRPGDGVDQVCQLLIELAKDPRPMERITIFSERVEVRRWVDPDEDVLQLTEGPPSSIESMLGSVRMEELPPSEESKDALRLAFLLTRRIFDVGATPICWVIGDGEMLNQGLGIWGPSFLVGAQSGALFGLPIKVSAELGVDRLVLVGGASRHHNPERGTHAVSAVMQWVGGE